MSSERAAGTVHACPPGRSNATPCCSRSPFDLPRTDRITEDPLLVTCDERRGAPRLLSRWEFQGVVYVLVTLSTADNDNITMEYMPEAAYRKWSTKR